MKINFYNFCIFVLSSILWLGDDATALKSSNKESMANSESARSHASFLNNAEMKNKFFSSHKKDFNYSNSVDTRGKAPNRKPAWIIDNSYYFLNNTFPAKPRLRMNTFMNANHMWDYKMIEVQLHDLFQNMILKEDFSITRYGMRHFINLFLNDFENCDTNKDNVLSFAEFKQCVKIDNHFKGFLVPPTKQYAPLDIYTNEEVYYQIIFSLSQSISYKTGMMNFGEYMLLRIMVFSWKKCTAFEPFLDEVSWECAIQVAVGSRILSRTTMRVIYDVALFFTNNEYSRNIDFVTYFIITSSLRLYSKINAKEDGDIIHKEFMLALEKNRLPVRYNRQVIEDFYRLVEEIDRPDQGIDVVSFVIYDFFLRLFDYPYTNRYYHLSSQDLFKVFANPLFPYRMLAEILSIPASPLTNASYQMYQMLNTTRYYKDDDFYMRFKEKSSETKIPVVLPQAKGHVTTNLPGGDSDKLLPGSNILLNVTNLPYITSRVFKLLDTRREGWIAFYEFGHFMQITYVFTKMDKFNNGRIVAGRLYEEMKNWYDYPIISYITRRRAERFSYLEPDLYLNLFLTMIIVRIDDVAAPWQRKVDPTIVYESEMKTILTVCNMEYLPDPYLKNCLRILSHDRVPKYDWECSIIIAVKQTAYYWEYVYEYQTDNQFNINVENTVFHNIDPNIRQDGTIVNTAVSQTQRPH